MIKQDDLNKKKYNLPPREENIKFTLDEFKFQEGETRAEQMSRVGKLPTANKLFLTENQIRYAMENSQSNKGASKFLGVAYDTYVKYSKMFIDKKTNKTLHQLQKEKWQTSGVKKNITRKYNYAKKNYIKVATPMNEILQGKHPKYDRARLKQRLFIEGYFEEKCYRCGFQERRVTDFTVPLYLCFKDDDDRNYHIDNIEVLCLNCAYLYYGDIRWRYKDIKGYKK